VKNGGGILPVLVFLVSAVCGQGTADSLRQSTVDTFPFLYKPPKAILNDRAFTMELFVLMDSSEIESVSLFLRNDSSQGFREFPLVWERGRYFRTLSVEDLAGSRLRYYFVVTCKDYAVWVHPLGDDGRIEPFDIDLVPPTLDFFQKRWYD